jgi:hypothetical protein
MEWIWAAQAATAFFVGVLGLWVWRLRCGVAQQSNGERVTASLHILETRIQEWDREVQSHREKMAQELRALQRICERAKEILERGQAEGLAQSPSQEEKELKHLALDAAPAAEPSAIPTLQQVEETKKRLRQHLSFDLRSLLRDQLA